MLPVDKHVRVELERLAEQQQNVAEMRWFAAATPRSAMMRRAAGWLGSHLTAWGTRLEAYSHPAPSRLLPNS